MVVEYVYTALSFESEEIRSSSSDYFDGSCSIISFVVPVLSIYFKFSIDYASHNQHFEPD